MQEVTLDGHMGRSTVIDLCHPCQAFWFDSRESLRLTPGSTLALFRTIGAHVAPSRHADGDTAKCPRCKARLTRTHDMQRTTRFEYLRCPHDHGRLTSFFDFLREKDFIRPLTPQQIAELRQHVQTVNCSNCGGPVDLTTGAACTHCSSPLSMLDLKQAGALVTQLQRAEDRTTQPIDPALPLELARARREVDVAFDGLERDALYLRDASSSGLVSAGLGVLARWLSLR
jgi:DNA-directed RNA polymerase subunit RPC12/RpoP